jgi:hypothetical protein
MSTPSIPPDASTPAPAVEASAAADATADATTPAPDAVETQPTLPRDAGYWAAQASTMRVSGVVPGRAINLNVDGKSPVSPLQGFGQMWQKTYVIRLAGVEVEPTEVISVWKQNFAQFWPPRNHFYGPITGIAPGEVALLNIAVGGMPLSTGVLVLYADDESFTLMTPQGHVFAGWITFCSYRDADGTTVAQAQVLMRANDPLYELGLRFGGQASEDRFWRHTLLAVARHFGVTTAPVVLTRVCVDRRIQWRHARNVWDNAAVRTTFYLVTSPLRWIGRLFGRRPQANPS